jgi:hypothetical protein
VSRNPPEQRDFVTRGDAAWRELDRLLSRLAELAPPDSPAGHRAVGRIAQGVRELRALVEKLEREPRPWAGPPPPPSRPVAPAPALADPMRPRLLRD